MPPLFSIPSEIDLAPNQPVSRVSANSCCFLSQALDALAVQRSRSPGFAHRRFKRLTIPTAEVRCGPYVLSRGVLNDAVSIYFADATLASVFVARWCAGYKVETADGVFRVRDDEPVARNEASLHRTR